jgi:hypothetical protein
MNAVSIAVSIAVVVVVMMSMSMSMTDILFDQRIRHNITTDGTDVASQMLSWETCTVVVTHVDGHAV